MCGIVAAASRRDIVPVLIEGLRRLEYRGYDSAGVAVLGNQARPQLKRLRAAGRVAELSARVDAQKLCSETGIAHTRWATHGAPSETNAHPHVSGGLAVVHNGIIENYEQIRASLTSEGYAFASETDSEVIAHLVARLRRNSPDLLSALCKAAGQLVGAFAVAVVSQDDPHVVALVRKGAPLLLGLGEGENFAASDASALIQVTSRVIYLEDGDCAEIRPDGVRVVDARGMHVERPAHVSEMTAQAVELGPYRHYMQKEIFEQPGALANTLEAIAVANSVQPGLFGADAAAMLKDVSSVQIVACGTSYHAGMVARYWIESIAHLPAQIDIASEYRYRAVVPDRHGLFVTISQSGETADTLAALEYAKSLGIERTLSICNVPESSLVRASHLRFLTRAGPEIGVASTKAFTTQLGALFLLVLVLAKLRRHLSPQAEDGLLKALRHAPAAIGKVLETEPEVQRWAGRFAQKHHALFLGRGIHWPIAM
ncbi:MAG: glutamine--fructose-6-phosphate transaminase (isomerizing), partial [Burkholderiales bacterium]